MQDSNYIYFYLSMVSEILSILPFFVSFIRPSYFFTLPSTNYIKHDSFNYHICLNSLQTYLRLQLPFLPPVLITYWTTPLGVNKHLKLDHMNCHI